MAVIVARDFIKQGWWPYTPHTNHKCVRVCDRPYCVCQRENEPDPSVRCVTLFGSLNDFGKTHLFDNRAVAYPRCHWARRCVLCNMWFSLEEDASTTDWPHNWEEATLGFCRYRNGREEPLDKRAVLVCRDCGAVWDMRAEDDDEPVKKKLL